MNFRFNFYEEAREFQNIMDQLSRSDIIAIGRYLKRHRPVSISKKRTASGKSLRSKTPSPERKADFQNLAEQAYMLAEALGLDIIVNSNDTEGAISLIGDSLILDQDTNKDHFALVGKLLKSAQQVCFTSDTSYDEPAFQVTLIYRLYI